MVIRSLILMQSSHKGPKTKVDLVVFIGDAIRVFINHRTTLENFKALWANKLINDEEKEMKFHCLYTHAMAEIQMILAHINICWLALWEQIDTVLARFWVTNNIWTLATHTYTGRGERDGERGRENYTVLSALIMKQEETAISETFQVLPYVALRRYNYFCLERSSFILHNVTGLPGISEVF